MAHVFRILAACLLIVLAAMPLAIAQDEEAERSQFERFIEEQISSPTMQIRLIGLEGALSRDVSLNRITVSDEDGVWLTIEQPRLRWRRSALLRGRLEIEELAADSLDFTRPPIADGSLPAPEARRFALPDLPVSIEIGALALPRASFGEQVFGLESVLSLDGSLTLETGRIDADLAIERLDGPGGALTLAADLSNEQLELDARLTEPADGVVANLIDLPDRPPVALALTGGGSLDALDIALSFDVDGARILDGALETRRGLFAGATTLDFDLSGPLADILPERERAFFGDRTALSGRLRLADEGGARIDRFDVETGVLTLAASGELLGDGFLSKLVADIALTAPDDTTIGLPGPSDVALQSARLALDYGGSGWSLDGDLQGLATTDMRVEKLTLDGRGSLSDLADPQSRALTYGVDASATGVRLADPALQRAFGEQLTVAARGDWQVAAPLVVEAFDMATDTARLSGAGEISTFAFDGKMALKMADLESFSGLAGRALTGAASLVLDGRVQPIGGAFDVTIEGGARDLGAGSDLVGRLLAGDLEISGGVARSVDGLLFSALEGQNDQASFAVSGTLTSETADLRAALSLADLALIDEASFGSAGVQIAVDRAPPPDGGADSAPLPFKIDAALLVPNGALAGQPVRGLRAGFVGAWLEDRIDGRLDGDGTLANQPIELAAKIAREGVTWSMRDLTLIAGDGRITGDVTYADNLADGNLSARAEDVAGLAALALIEASGTLNADIALSGDEGVQNANVTATASGLSINDVRIAEADIEAALRDLFGTPTGTATVSAGGIDAGGQRVERLKANVTPGDAADTLAFDAQAAMRDGIAVDTRGSVAFGATADIGLTALNLSSPYGDAQLAAPARIVLDDGTTRFEQLALLVGGGRVTASGSVGETLAIDTTFTALPLTLINTVQPDLGVAGTLGGQMRLRGRPSALVADFTLSGNGLSTTDIRQAGIDPFEARASGTFASNQVKLASLTAGNGQGAQLSASGTIPLAGSGLNVATSGTAPLALANRFLVARGTQLDGAGRFEATITGQLARPTVSGLFSVAGGRIVDPQSNLELDGVNLLAGLEGDRVIIRNASAGIRRGGGLTLSGTVDLNAGNPANLALEIAGARFSDGQLYSADLGGRLTIDGPLAGGALIAGQIDIARADVTVPESFAGNADLLDVQHVGADAATRRTLARIEAVLPRARGARSAPYRLNVAVNAPNQLFVRGRGLDAELGGRITVTGPVTAPVPVGAFNLIRGRLAVLNRRLDFTEGSISLTGDLDPFLRLTAATTAGDLTAFVTLTGPVSDLRLQLTSSPTLPEDEILARILFGEDIGSLSATQLAQLAGAAASLAGGDSDLAGGLRGALGLDDLDVTQGEDGGVGVRAGRYISDNAYLEVEAGADGAETSINLDITDSLTARGSARTDGNSSLGVFFERDY